MHHDEFTAAVALLAETSITHPKLRAVRHLAWAVEEELHRGEDGLEYLVPTSEDDEWTISIGWARVIAELPYSIDPDTADAVAVVRGEHDDPSLDTFFRVEWVGPALDLPTDRLPDDGERVVKAVSIERLGELLVGAFGAGRVGIEMVHDPAWALHRHPIGSLGQPTNR